MPLIDLLEKVFARLLPPACREHVLGDLRERAERSAARDARSNEKRQSAGRYFAEAVSVLAPVIVSRIRRTTDPGLFSLEVLAVYLSFAGSAWSLGERAFLYDAGFARLLIPTVVIASALLLCNAYADPQKASPMLKPIRQSAGCVGLAFLGQTLAFDHYPSAAIPFAIMLYGSCVSVVLVSTLRMLFPAQPSGPLSRRF